MSSFSLLLALRYLKPKRTFVSIITLISILGVSFGVAAPMVVISVMNGCLREIQNSVLEFESHIDLTDFSPHQPMPSETDDVQNEDPRWKVLKDILEKKEGVVSVSPFIRGNLFLEYDGEPTATVFFAIDPEDPALSAKVQNLMANGLGEADLYGDTIMVGMDLARSLGLQVGSQLTVYAPNELKSMLQEFRRVNDDPELREKEGAFDQLQEMMVPIDLTVTGIFDSLRYNSMVIVSLDMAQHLMNMENQVSGLAVQTPTPFEAGEVLQRLEPLLHEWGFASMTWYERWGNIFDSVRMEISMMYFVLFLILIVAAFCVMNTMITITVQKRREIGILNALGAKLSQIVLIFLAQGFVVGLFGALSGISLGLLILWKRETIRAFVQRLFDVQILDQSVYGFVTIPSQIQFQDIVFIAGGAFLLCMVAAFIPAWMAASTDPAKALRNEA